MLNIEFKGKNYVLVGDLVDGAIATRKQYENFECSYAHLYKDGIIRRFGIPIGTKEDIKVINND